MTKIKKKQKNRSGDRGRREVKRCEHTSYYMIYESHKYFRKRRVSVCV